ncbi:MAG: hypothetical protein P8130_06145, partial [Deltaproteobacteria bacterium]
MQLSGTDQDFFRTIRQVIFANPFSDTRDELDRDLIGERIADEKLANERLVGIVDDRLDRAFNGQSRTTLRFQGEDRTLV